MPTPTVLIVANPYEAGVARRAVEQAGLRAAISDGGERALDLYESEVPSLVVLALGLLSADAAELLASLRAPDKARVPVIVVGETQGDEADMIRPLGADHWLARPVDVEALAAAIRRFTGEEEELALEIGEVYEAAHAPAPEEAAEGEEAMPPPSRAATEVLPPPGAPAMSPTEAPRRKEGQEASWILRADEAMSDPAGPLDVESVVALGRILPPETPRPPLESVAAGGVPDASVFATQLPLPPDEDSLADIDLETLGADHLPQIEMELDFEEPPAVVVPAPVVAQTPAPATPVVPSLNDTVFDSLPADAPLARLAAERVPTPLPQAELRVRAAPTRDLLPDTGDIGGEHDLVTLLGRLYRDGYTGRLLLVRDLAERSIYFDGGLPVYATSSLPRDGFLEHLWREGRITRDQLAGFTEAVRIGRTVAGVLLDAGVVVREELHALVRRWVEELIYACFGWDRARWTLGPETASPDERVRIEPHPYALALEGVRRRWPLELLAERVGPRTTAVEPDAALDAIVTVLPLPRAERDALDRVRRTPHTVAALAEDLDERAAYALVHTLLRLGGLRRVTGTAPNAGDPDRARQVARAKHAQIADADYFAVLGVGRDATDYEIARAFEQARRDFAAERFPPAVREELAFELGDIAEVLDEARRVLADEELRASYRAHLVA